jgi:hypothetical protein
LSRPPDHQIYVDHVILLRELLEAPITDEASSGARDALWDADGREYLVSWRLRRDNIGHSTRI